MNPFMKAFGVIAVMIVGSLAASHVRTDMRADRCIGNVQKMRASIEANQPRSNLAAMRARIDNAEQLCIDKQMSKANQMLSNVAVSCVMQKGCHDYRTKVSSSPVFR